MRTVLHYLSVVDWDRLDADANFEVFLKTLRFLQAATRRYHHLVLLPRRVHAVVVDVLPDSVTYTLLPYEYAGNVVSARHRVQSDELARALPTRRLDVDYVFCHQPEVLSDLLEVLSAKRVARDTLDVVLFFHWIDCPYSRGSGAAVPVHRRQQEAIELADWYFVHCSQATAFFPFAPARSPALMPLSPAPWDGVPAEQPDDWVEPDAPFLVFNHRKRKSAGWPRVARWCQTAGIALYCTRDHRLTRPQYRYVLERARAAVCCLGPYATWNLALQDALLLGRPLLATRHPVVSAITGPAHTLVHWFDAGASGLARAWRELESLQTLNNSASLPDFDADFRQNLLVAMAPHPPAGTHCSRHTARWLEELRRAAPGTLTKSRLVARVHGLTATAHASWSYVRRDLLHEPGVSCTVVPETGETVWRWSANDV